MTVPISHVGCENVIVVEGYFDAAKVLMWCLKEGKTNYVPVAFGGSNVSKEQLSFLSSFDRVVLGYDNDKAGSRAIDKVAGALSNMPLYRLNFDGKDPGEGNFKSFSIKLLV